ncbi:MAG: hypothetical protein H7263_14455 [Candidatus Sericytochromatia bacterium]|nr:hypothetical protein [Candidatus Sericytochromatia bacterium]
MQDNNTPSTDSESLLAAVSYFPFFSLVMIFIYNKRYFVKYNAGHAIIIYTLSLIFLISYIGIYSILRNIVTDLFMINVAWGLVFSFHLLINFIYLLYCSVQAYLGRYMVVPIVTKIYYVLFNR